MVDEYGVASDLFLQFSRSLPQRRFGKKTRTLARLIGYSVCGYCDVFTNDKVDSSMWDDEK